MKVLEKRFAPQSGYNTMRKALLIIFIALTLGSLGHDVYLYQQKPEKGFSFAAIGNLWSKYHPETFTQWKVKTEEVSKKIDSVTNNVLEKSGALLPLPADNGDTKDEKVKAPYEEAFDQTDLKDGGPTIKQVRRAKEENAKPSNLQKFISVILAQKATFLLGGIALFIFLVGWIFARLAKIKENASMPKGARGKKMQTTQRKGGGYGYNRK